VQSLTTKLNVHAYVEPEDWGFFFGLSAPFFDGHRKNFLAQNMRAKVHVEVKKRSWWFLGPWDLVFTDTMHGAAMEFGGDYYPERGDKGKQD
jgi:hypothetical protein